MMTRCLAFLLLAAALHAQELTPALEARFRDSVAALRAGNLDLAETLLGSIIAKGGRAAFVYHNLGIIQQQRGRHAEAVGRFREAVKLDPGFAPSSLLLGVSLAAQGRNREAAVALETAVRVDPAQPHGRLELARVYERMGNLPAAVEQYERLAALRPDDPEAGYHLARAYERLSAWAVRRLQCAGAGAARWHQLEAEAYLRQGLEDRAVESYRAALVADARLAGSHLGLAAVYAKGNRKAEALAELERELQVAPDSAAARELKRLLLRP